jgi:hypothetical protein
MGRYLLLAKEIEAGAPCVDEPEADYTKAVELPKLAGAGKPRVTTPEARRSAEPFAGLADLSRRAACVWGRVLDERRDLRDRLVAAEDRLSVEAVRDTLEAIIATFPSLAPVIESGETSSVDGVPARYAAAKHGGSQPKAGWSAGVAIPQRRPN